MLVTGGTGLDVAVELVDDEDVEVGAGGVDVEVAAGAGGVDVEVAAGAGGVDVEVAAGGAEDDGVVTDGAGASVAMAPTTINAIAAPTATPPAARVLNIAHDTRPRMRATTATTKTYRPDRTNRPPTPELAAPKAATRSSPPQPNHCATPDPARPVTGATSSRWLAWLR